MNRKTLCLLVLIFALLPMLVVTVVGTVTGAESTRNGSPSSQIGNWAERGSLLTVEDGPAASFQAARLFDAGKCPVSVAVGDFNGDGNPDLVTANYSFDQNNVSILLGDGAGGFGAATNFPAGPGPRAVVVEDFNGDSNLDLAVANNRGNNVSILLGNGMGGFAAPVNFAVGTNPVALAVGDFNNDGKLDLAVVNEFGNSVSILLGNGMGGFAPAVNVTTPARPQAIAVADFNNDGNPDLVVALYLGSVNILLGNGQGGFGQPISTVVYPYSRATSVAVADFNADGKLDLAVAQGGNEEFARVSILLGDGTGRFGAPTHFNTLPNSVFVGVGDFNGDGKPDLAVVSDGGRENFTTYRSPGVSILLGNGTGGFAVARSFPSGPHVSYGAIADFDGDGNLDVVTVNTPSILFGGGFCSSSVTALMGDGTGGLLATPSFPTGSTNPWRVAVGDFNGDGNQDLVTLSDRSVISVLLGNGAGGFGTPITFTMSGATELAVGDFNNDGKPDLVVANYPNLSILLGDGTGRFGAPINVTTPFGILYLAVEDFNVDGNFDIVASGGSEKLVLLGDGTGHFTVSRQPWPAYGVVGDFNGDGNPDLVCVGGGCILLGDGQGGFRVVNNTTAPAQVFAVAVGDFNGDGKLDLAAVSWSSGSGFSQGHIQLGDGTGRLGAPLSFTVGFDAWSIVAADFNGDGKLDLAITEDRGQEKLDIFLGDGTGRVGPPAKYAIESSPWRMVTEDFNNDGMPDLVTVNSTSNDVSVLINTSTPPAGRAAEAAAR